MIRRTQDARKEPLSPADALRLARAALRVVAARGRAIVEIDMRAAPPPTDDDLLRVLLGPSGKLRAPALRIGGTLLVGFSQEAYRAALAGKR